MIKSLYEKHTSAERCSWGWRYRSAWGGAENKRARLHGGVSAAPRWIHTAATSRASFRERNPPQEITRWFLSPRNPHFSRQNLPKPPLAPAPLERQRPGQAASSPRATNHKQHRSEAAEVLPPPLSIHSSLYHPQISQLSARPYAALRLLAAGIASRRSRGGETRRS